MRALLVNDASLAGHHGSALVTARLVAIAARHGIELVAGWDWPAVEALGDALSSFDLVVVNGEGSIHDDAKSAHRIAAIADQCFARSLPAYLVNASISGLGKAILSSIGRFRLLHVRDTTSQAYLQANGIESRVVHDATLTWADGPVWRGGGPVLVTDASEEGKTKRLIGIQRSLPGSRMISLRTKPPQPTRGSTRRQWQYRIKSLLSAPMPLSAWSLRYARSIEGLDRFAAVLATSGGVLAGRYHAVCLALRLGVPFLAIDGNTSKTRDLLADVGLTDRLVSLDRLAQDAAAGKPPAFSGAEKERIAAFLAKTEAAAEAMFAAIASDAKERRLG
jgi:polysaccharide pyruvyl transferase WcaK-like protein